MIRDDEIQRLIHYAKGMGVRVTVFSKSRPGAHAAWAIDGSSIEVYAGPDKNKTDIILDLIHEISHHLWFIHEKNRQPDLKFEEALTREDLYPDKNGPPTPKHLRKKIWDVEAAGTAYWDIIYKDTGLKIPMWKVEAAKEFDTWMYEVYYETGHFPKGKFKKEHYRKVQAKHKACVSDK